MNIDIDSALDALGDPTRRRIVGRLAAGPLDVGGIAASMTVGRAAVSMHLRVLKDAGLVSDQPIGNRRVYRLEPDAMRQLRDHLDWYWERSLAAFKQAAEARAREREAKEREMATRSFLSPTAAAGGMNGPPTAPKPTGAPSSPGSLRTVSCSPGRSGRGGPTSPTRPAARK